MRLHRWLVVVLLLALIVTCDSPDPGRYPVHRDIVATTFWVGEVFDPDAPDGSQVLSAYDSSWLENYGGCDGIIVDGTCQTEPRRPDNDYFPTAMTPRENPFYLDLPYDDVNDPRGFADRDRIVPWAGEPRYRAYSGDRSVSYLKNRWVRITRGNRTCYGQIQDAGPGEYYDHEYVFGTARPANRRYNNAGMDVSPALNGCLGFTELNGQRDLVDWQFVDDDEVPPGPWTRIVTTRQVTQP
ncbi:hypothetical protein ABZ863_24670 [Saccharomonospora sp. NPDC046836]|uniref:hypothetical protein n=1 Tax=Saccharomonospora sp. NPDC046836 TaxID=3156921 RepID=UPI0033F85471